MRPTIITAMTLLLFSAAPTAAAPCDGMPQPDRSICQNSRMTACFNYGESVMNAFGYKAAGVSKYRVLNTRGMFKIYSDKDAEIISSMVDNVYASHLKQFGGDEMKAVIQMCNAGLQLPY